MFKVLLPLDKNGERTKKQAEFVASLPNASQDVEVTALYVFPAGTAGELSLDNNPAAELAVEYLEEEGITVHRAADSGNTSETILNHAKDFDPDLIVMGGRRRTGLEKVLMGSRGMDVIQATRYPVTVID